MVGGDAEDASVGQPSAKGFAVLDCLDGWIALDACVMLLMALGLSYPTRVAAQEIIVLAEHQYQAEIDLLTGDTIAVVQLKDVYCFTKKHFRDKKHEKEFLRMVYDVKKTLPIAKDARRLMTQAYFDMERMTETEQKVYFRQRINLTRISFSIRSTTSPH